MRENNKISNNQIRGLIVSTIIGVGVLFLPSSMATEMGNDGWIPIIIGGAISVGAVIVMNKMFNLYPDKDFFQIGKDVLGKWIFNFFLVIFFLYSLFVMATLARHLAEITKAFLLETTPPEIIIVSFILATSYIARCEIQILGRAAYLIYPIIIITITALVILAFPSIDHTNVLPVLQSDMSKLPKAIMTGFFSFAGFEILLLSLPFAEDKNKLTRSSVIGIAIVMVIYLVVFFLTLSQYGIYGLRRQTFPTLSIIKEIDLPGLFIENLDGIAMAIWILIIFSTMAATYYSAGKVLSDLFTVREHGLFIIPLVPITYIISLIPQTVLEVETMLGKMVNYFGFIVLIIMPLLIYLIGLYKTRRNSG